MENLEKRAKLIVLAGYALVAPLLGLTLAGMFLFADLEEGRGAGAGWLPIYSLAAGLIAGFGLIPTHCVSLLAGYLFGIVGGGAGAFAAVAIGSWMGLTISSKIAGGSLEDVLKNNSFASKIHSKIIGGGHLEIFFGIMLARLPPQMPFALGNVIAGSLRVGTPVFLAATLVGMAPRIMLAVWVGSGLASWDINSSPPAGLWLSLAGAAIGFGGLFLWGYRAARHPDNRG